MKKSNKVIEFKTKKDYENNKDRINESPESLRNLLVFCIENNDKFLLKRNQEYVISGNEIMEIIEFYKEQIDTILKFEMEEINKYLDKYLVKVGGINPGLRTLYQYHIEELLYKKEKYEGQLKKIIAKKRYLTNLKKKLQYDLYAENGENMQTIKIADVCVEYLNENCKEYSEQLEARKKSIKDEIKVIIEKINEVEQKKKDGFYEGKKAPWEEYIEKLKDKEKNNNWMEEINERD